ncbi:hypothetical protein H112_00329 [Trichophyton rubrum D6]|uniref:Uncharacterized protein n=3 Tax=Trichophyton TaxID=5550 RepID=A0A178F957_TRIRU|nr:hypothetical protein H100_00330 [Trichophyton rubrum MR850]EZF46751.1 hypothetical protein H102_00329 [Trichophyton rubrum CBS 100081]EZF57405.1 hypothetical protein H103_00328 [Trichophyton rubrum CBS 288.86]EZF67979.1 hypothetical protein H104_00328 [Trichophyton rubrum CBS 289.86]EZF78602.1 hypothetical protein H105_00324 [Trichophyton soudanense CBS 452.61]EZF89227.1 hypothetical protein H110_00332 [Trichophyton rubrum MR1448]EZG21617.1 hypothetical protein H107_00366 [Trichophyton rub
MGLGLRERVKRAIFSSRPGLSSPPSSSRLAERLKQAKEHTNSGPSQNKLQHRHRHRHQHQHQQHQNQHQQQQQPQNQEQMHPPTSPTTKKSFRASIIKTLSPRTSNRKSKIEEPWPKIELYKPHEIPRPKYRGPVDKRHLAVLEAYSIVQATEGYRQRSIDSSVCPLATNLPSRRDSVTSISETVIVRRPGDVEAGVGEGQGEGEGKGAGEVEVEVAVEAQVDDDDINIRNTNRDSLQDEEDSNTTSTVSSDEGANVSSSTLLTSHTEDEHLQHLQKQQRLSVTRLKRTTAFTAADLHHALNSL